MAVVVRATLTTTVCTHAVTLFGRLGSHDVATERLVVGERRLRDRAEGSLYLRAVRGARLEVRQHALGATPGRENSIAFDNAMNIATAYGGGGALGGGAQSSGRLCHVAG